MSISVEEFLNIDNPIVIDIRNSYYYNISHIENSISIPYYNLINNHSFYLNKSDIYYLYCDTGDKSYEVASRLDKFGYNTFSISGGYIEYQKKVKNL